MQSLHVVVCVSGKVLLKSPVSGGGGECRGLRGARSWRNAGNPDIDKQLPQHFMECRHYSDVNFHFHFNFGNIAFFVRIFSNIRHSVWWGQLNK